MQLELEMEMETSEKEKLSNQVNTNLYPNHNIFDQTLKTIDFAAEQINHNKLGHSFRTYKDSFIERSHRKYYSKVMEKKNSQNLQSRQKIQSKMPFFKTQQQILHNAMVAKYQKLGLQDYLKQIVVGQNKIMDAKKSYQIIKSLNNTWISTNIKVTPRRNMTNSIGIKKSTSNTTQKVQWRNPEQLQLEDDFKQIGYISNYVFPCRKKSNSKANCFEKSNSLDRSRVEKRCQSSQSQRNVRTSQSSRSFYQNQIKSNRTQSSQFLPLDLSNIHINVKNQNTRKAKLLTQKVKSKQKIKLFTNFQISPEKTQNKLINKLREISKNGRQKSKQSKPSPVIHTKNQKEVFTGQGLIIGKKVKLY